MAGRIRVLDSANRTMQRLGYLKALAALVKGRETSNLDTLGKRLISRVTQRVKLMPPYDENLREYAKTRLTDGAYRRLRKTIMESTEPVGVELQDVYLADKSLPSSTGKLVEANWRRYPYLGTSLELVKKGTYSALTRSLVLLAVTPNEEVAAFGTLDMEHNPMRVSDAQSAVLLYCFLDNDAEVLLPLMRACADFGNAAFDEREMGDLLPRVLRDVISSHEKQSLKAEERDRLSLLKKSASSIERWKDKSYTGGGARQETITVRLEPLCDLGFLSKPERERYAYIAGKPVATLVSRWQKAGGIDKLLHEGFFAAFAACRGIKTRKATDGQATKALAEAGEALKSTLGYTPITDVGLLAGIRLLTEKQRILELSRTVDLLKALQKQDPNFVRFTVDRMGALAHVKFPKNAPGA